MRISEADLIYPALLLIDTYPEINTSTLITKLEDIFCPQGEDAEILAGRADSKFSQIVRNLVSHETLVRLEYAVFTESEDRQLGGTFTITPYGHSVLLEKRADLEALLSSGFSYDDLVYAVHIIGEDEEDPGLYLDENIVIAEGGKKPLQTSLFERSLLLKSKAAEHYADKHGRISCAACGFNFENKYGEMGKGFIEIHHEQPLFIYKREKDQVFLKDALKVVKPLCSNCHRMIHLGPRSKQMSVAELKARLVK